MPGKTDPYRNNRFHLEIDGISQAGFREATISNSAQDPIEYREGDEPPTVRKIPGLIKYGNLVLKWGTTDSMDLFNWRKAIEDGKTKDNRKKVAVVLLDEEGNTKARWEFTRAWATRYEAPALNATASEIAIETLEIAHEGMLRTK
jgi:phage tail-like protein